MFSRRPKGATMHNQGKSGIASLLWMLFGAIVTLGVGVFMYKSGVFDLGANNQPEPTQKEIQTKVDLDKDNKEEGYDFYKVLPDQDSQTIPDTLVPDQPTDKEIKKQAERLKPDVVITGTQEELDAANPAKNKAMQKPEPFKPADGSEPQIVVEYENGTYGDDGVPNKSDNNTISTAASASQTNTAKDTNVTSTNSQTVDGIKTLKINETSTPKNVDSSTNNTITAKPSTGSQNSNTTNNPVAIVKPASDTDKANKPSKNYILQVNSFDSADEADHRRAQVLMAGVDAYVIKNTANNQTVYQVVSNSMSSKESVIQNQQRLKNSGIDSLVIEQRVK